MCQPDGNPCNPFKQTIFAHLQARTLSLWSSRVNGSHFRLSHPILQEAFLDSPGWVIPPQVSLNPLSSAVSALPALSYHSLGVDLLPAGL